ncbi:MAG: hypothetical protein JXA97_12550 [Anaerolineales bacterium]|nr:hypothetical protein [Anaerolineales bacterium]
MAVAEALAYGEAVVFEGFVLGQDGSAIVAEGEQQSENWMGSVDWLVERKIGRPNEIQTTGLGKGVSPVQTE